MALILFDQTWNSPTIQSIFLPYGLCGLTFTCWGAGGAGGMKQFVATTTGFGGGGGGGVGISKFDFYPPGSEPGTEIQIVVGQGGTSPNDGGHSYVYSGATLKFCQGGGGGGVAFDSKSAGLLGKGVGNYTSYQGGSGSSGSTISYGGGGGGGAGSMGNGTNGLGSVGGAGGSGGGGKGGSGRILTGGAGSNGTSYGGGGGGALYTTGGSTFSGGAGANGAVNIQFYWPGDNYVLNIINKFSRGTLAPKTEMILNAGGAGQTVWVDSNSDGLADYWFGDVDCTYNITSNVDFPSSVQQQVDIGAASQASIGSNAFHISSTKTYTLSFWYQSAGDDLTVTLGTVGGSNAFPASRGAVYDTYTYTPSANESSARLMFSTPSFSVDGFIIDQVQLLES